MKLRLLSIALLLSSLVLAQPNNSGKSDELKILSWNIYMLPSFVYATTKKKLRAREIVKELKQTDYDIIIFQEAFHRRSRKRLRKGLKEKFPYRYGPAHRKFFSFKTNSGIWILSRQPLKYIDAIKYNECEGDGCLARKGAMMMEGEHNGYRFQIIGTHNNGGAVNDSQFAQIRHELLDPHHKEGVPQLICGDFNTKKSSPNGQWQNMIKLFDANMDYIQHDDRSEKHKQAWPVEDLYERWPDFIFVRQNNCQNLDVKRISTVSFGPTWQQGPTKKVFGETVGLSDHYPVQIILDWE